MLGSEKVDFHELQKEIAAVACPEEDPVYGKDGPLVRLWSRNLLVKASL